MDTQDIGQHCGAQCQVTTSSESHGRGSQRRTTAAVVLGCVLVVTCFLWIRRNDIWPLPMSVLNSSMAVDGEDREFRLVIPDSVSRESSIPLVFALHGAFDTTSEMAAYTDLDRLAVQEGFLLVYLQGRHRSWPPSISAENPHVMDPDIRFFEAMCDWMVRQYQADPRRIYLVGVSQGGAMANALTVQCSQRIAATVSCCGWLPEPLGDEPLHTKHKCPILFVVGSQDVQVSPATVQAVHDDFAQAGHPVDFWLIEGMGHGWPANPGGNHRIWEFLSAQRLPAQCASTEE